MPGSDSVDQGVVVVVMYLDFNKAFVTLSHGILTWKLGNVGWASGPLDGLKIGWTARGKG